MYIYIYTERERKFSISIIIDNIDVPYVRALSVARKGKSGFNEIIILLQSYDILFFLFPKNAFYNFFAEIEFPYMTSCCRIP